MTDMGHVRLARLRGSLPAAGPGARGLERLARNPACERLRAITLVGSTPAAALAEVYGEVADEGQSPFAIGAGNRFEDHLFRDGAAALLGLYREHGRLTPGEGRVANVAELAPGSGSAALARRRTLSQELLRRKLAGDPAAPNLIVKPRLVVRILDAEHAIEPDALVTADAEPFYRVVEIKSYPDRAGKTSLADIRGACRQAAVGVVGLRQALADLDATDPAALTPPRGDLVLRRPGSMGATLRPMTLNGEIASLERALDGAGDALAALERLLARLGPGATLGDATVLDALPNNYQEGCREHCALAGRCKREAAARGDLILLGSAAREELAAAGSLGRTLELLHGGGPPPRTAEERGLQARLQIAHAAYQVAVGGPARVR